MIRQLLLLFMFTVVALGLSAQQVTEQKRLIYFTDKKDTPYSLQQPQQFLSEKALARRERQHIPLTLKDLPVNPAYVAGLQQKGAAVWYTSRWFNAAVVQCSDAVLAQLQSLPYVKGARTLNNSNSLAQERMQVHKTEAAGPVTVVPIPAAKEAYGVAFHQANMLGATELHKAGYAGEDMTIAVLDAGFPGVSTIPAFSHLFENGKLKGTFDFVQKQAAVFADNPHGTSVLSTMAAYAPGKFIGTAFNANYILLRTEDAASEQPIEEVNWLVAAEYADSAGADVINSSLGYTSFDAPAQSYTYADLDGNITLISRAADMAAATGMLVVVSAGNEGNDPWHYISAPADADSVLTVGAVDSLGMKASFSSFGPTADGQLKPDVVAQGARVYVLGAAGGIGKSNGTSFSSPIMAGFATCLWQANPGKSNFQLIALLRQLGSNFSAPNNAIGYGIPNYSRLLTGLPAIAEAAKASITNPVVQQEINITLSEEWAKQHVSVHVFDAAGRLMYQQQLPGGQSQYTLGLKGQDLKKGLYLCRIHGGNNSATLRFVKL